MHGSWGRPGRQSHVVSEGTFAGGIVLLVVLVVLVVLLEVVLAVDGTDALVPPCAGGLPAVLLHAVASTATSAADTATTSVWCLRPALTGPPDPLPAIGRGPKGALTQEVDDVTDHERGDEDHHQAVKAGDRPTPTVVGEPESPDTAHVEDERGDADGKAYRGANAGRHTEQRRHDREDDVAQQASQRREQDRSTEDAVRRRVVDRSGAVGYPQQPAHGDVARRPEEPGGSRIRRDDRLTHESQATTSGPASPAAPIRERWTAQLLGTSDHGRSLSTRGSPGRPRTRSPRMVRWISDVPPSIDTHLSCETDRVATDDASPGAGSALSRMPGTERTRRFRPKLRWELIGCGLHGHELVGTDAAAVRPEDHLLVREADGVRWYRCLRCDSWLPLVAPVSAPHQYPPDRSEITLPLRGRPLRDRYVLRLIAVDRVVHFLVLAALAAAIILFAAHQKDLRGDYTRILNSLQAGVGGPFFDSTRDGLLREINHLVSLPTRKLYLYGFAIAAYAAINGLEAVGLWRAKRWAEYLTLVEVSVLLPLEIYELTLRISWLKIVTLVLNLAVVAYLLWAHRLLGLRGGGRAEQAAHDHDTGWGALERATPSPSQMPAMAISAVAANLSGQQEP